MILYIIRHGETEWNVQQKNQGHTDILLNENGRILSQITADALENVHFDLIISSPLSRAIETATIIMKKRELPVRYDERIMEINWGKWDGIYSKDASLKDMQHQLKLYFEKPWEFTGAPDGESMSQVYERVKSFCSELVNDKKFEDKTVLISTHGTIVRLIMYYFLNDGNNNDLWRGAFPRNCSINIIKTKGQEVTLLQEDVLFYDSALSPDYYVISDF